MDIDFNEDPSSYSQPVSCCVCGFNEVTKDYYSRSIHSLAGINAIFYLRVCPQCATFYNNPQWQPNILKVFYETQEYRVNNPVNDNYLKEIVKTNFLNYEKYLDSAEQLTEIRRYLDVGCGMAVMLSEAASRFWEVWGIDLCELPINYAKIKLRLKNLIVGTFTQKPEWQEYFDFISMNDYLDRTNDPNEQLELARYSLRKGGLLQILIPNIYSPMVRYKPKDFIKPPQHLWLWGRQQIIKLLKKHEFDIVWVKSGKSYTGQLWINAIKR